MKKDLKIKDRFALCIICKELLNIHEGYKEAKGWYCYNCYKNHEKNINKKGDKND